jgi:phospholipid/cholesterol/gamma-HCH transport system substrate-binding protein
MSKATRDFVVGLFVLAGLATLGYLALQVGGVEGEGEGGLELVAEFTDLGGLKERAPVLIYGVRVGRVKRIELKPDLTAAVAVLDINSSYELDSDTEASIRTEGLLGQQFVDLAPGAGDSLLKSGDRIGITHPAVSIEGLVSKFIHGNDIGETEE